MAVILLILLRLFACGERNCDLNDITLVYGKISMTPIVSESTQRPIVSGMSIIVREYLGGKTLAGDTLASTISSYQGGYALFVPSGEHLLSWVHNGARVPSMILCYRGDYFLANERVFDCELMKFEPGKGIRRDIVIGWTHPE